MVNIVPPILTNTNATKYFMHYIFSMANYVKIKDLGKSKLLKAFHPDGYVMNSSRTCWQKSSRHALTREQARSYLSSLQGNPMAIGTFDQIVHLCHDYYYVEPNETTGPYFFICDCEGFRTRAECSHVVAAAHLAKKINLKEKLRRISRPSVRGRPLKYQRIGPASHASASHASTDTDIGSAKYIGTAVAWYFQGYSPERPFTGQIIGARPVGTNESNTVIYYEAEFPPQLGDPDVDNIELTEGQVLQAHKDYMEYVNNRPKSKG